MFYNDFASDGKAKVALESLRLQVLDAGWNPVPVSPSDKACYVTDWPKIETCEFHIENWSVTNPAHTNTGFVCNRNYLGIDGDTRDKSLAHRLMGAAFNMLGHTPFIRVGQAPKFLLVYRKETPTSVHTARFKFEGRDGDGLEILSAGAIFTAFGIHPATRKDYIWVGEANPLEDTPDDAPLVTQDKIDAFIAEVREFAPFAVRPNGQSNPDAPRAYNSEGLVTDGRENLLRDCIYQAACEIHRAGDALDARAVAARGWELFCQRAWLDDAKWTPKDALARAASIVRRVRSGIVTFGDPELAKAIFYYYVDRLASAVTQGRELLRVGIISMRDIGFPPTTVERADA